MTPELVANGIPEAKNNSTTVNETRPGVALLRSWLNKNMKVEMSDGRFLVGTFLCTDQAGNVIIGSCNEYITDPDDPKNQEDGESCEGRILGLALVPGHHLVRMWVDTQNCDSVRPLTTSPLSSDSDDQL